MILDITKLGEEVLRQKAEPIAEVNDEIRKLAEDMLETMVDADGVGLAAPQIGKSIRMDKNNSFFIVAMYLLFHAQVLDTEQDNYISLHKYFSPTNNIQSLLQGVESLSLKVINRIEELKS
jgi:uncharacterized protein (UPF0335 family)